MTRLAQFKPMPPNLPPGKEDNMPDKKRKPAPAAPAGSPEISRACGCAGRQTGKT